MKAGTYKYLAGAGADQVVINSKALLQKIIIGKDVGSAVVEVSDHASDGDGNVQLYFESSTLLADTGGCVEVGAVFEKGITLDLTNQTNVTVIYSPLA